MAMYDYTTLQDLMNRFDSTALEMHYYADQIIQRLDNEPFLSDVEEAQLRSAKHWRALIETPE